MQFVAGGMNKNYLYNIHKNVFNRTTSVKAAIAYATDSKNVLLNDCLTHRIPLTFWCRYDSTFPISLPFLKRLLDAKSPSVVCKLVPDIFHAKVIWWQGGGVYIGSANLTDSGWIGNIEAGLYLDEEEIQENDLDIQLINFFNELDNYSYPLRREIYDQLSEARTSYDKIEKIIQNYRDKIFNKSRVLPVNHPLLLIDNSSSGEKRKKSFIEEWSRTLQFLRDIGDRVSDSQYRPVWISESVEEGVQADQFLHAYYYEQVRDGNRSRHPEFHEINKSDPEKALINAMNWWKLLQEPPHDENITIEKWAPFIKESLTKFHPQELSRDTLIQILQKIHALRDHALRVRKETLGISPNSDSMKAEDRIVRFSEWLYEQKSEEGKSIIETVDFILNEGDRNRIPGRIWDATEEKKWKIPHFGVSSIGELVGWVFPSDFPPRNGRTSKALYSLGYDVQIHSE